MSDDEVRKILSLLTDMELIELHSYIRSYHTEKMVNISEILEADESFGLDLSLDFWVDGSKLMLYAERELSKRNTN